MRGIDLTVLAETISRWSAWLHVQRLVAVVCHHPWVVVYYAAGVPE